MRNLAEYPITLDEAISAVEEAQDAYMDNLKKLAANGYDIPLGDIHMPALVDAVNRLKALKQSNLEAEKPDQKNVGFPNMLLFAMAGAFGMVALSAIFGAVFARLLIFFGPTP